MNTEPELRLKCLELGMTQAKMEGHHGNLNRVVEIATQFYNHITDRAPAAPVTELGKPGRKPKADKAPAIFE